MIKIILSLAYKIFKKTIDYKASADGNCGLCRNVVPVTSSNKFYCSAYCRKRAFKIFHGYDWTCITCGDAYCKKEVH